MKIPGRHVTPSRTYTIGIAALVLLVTTVSLGIYLGTQTREKFKEVEASWVFYEGDVGRKGFWISSIRGYLGYGGIIHNFKNYVLRGDSVYLDRASEQIVQFNQVVSKYREQPVNRDERLALDAIQEAIDKYQARLPIVSKAFDKGLGVKETDRLVAVDDSAAIKALANLEVSWQRSRGESSVRVFSAVEQGQKLIWIGFASIVALVLAALIIGILLLLLYRDLRNAVSQLSDELKVRRELEKSEGRLASAVEQSPATIFITDTDAKILYVNQRFTQLTGWSSGEVVGKTPKFLQSGDTPPEVYQSIRKALKRGEEWRGVFRNRKKNGESYWVESSILPLISSDGTVQNFIGAGEDITEKRQAREQIARAQKLEAVGLIAGGIAHDFNNILTTIVGAAHLAKLDAPADSDIAGEIDQINIAAKRAQSLVKELLTFARREPGKPTAIDLPDMIREITHLLKASIPPTIKITRPQSAKNCRVMADHTQLHQIIMNLTRNAAEAIGSNPGNIQFTYTRSENYPPSLPHRQDGWIELSISDDGPGMSAQTLEKLYDPFFTTKPMGKGSGLGMAVVSGLVEEMGGEILAISELGKGTTFSVFLPAIARDSQTTKTPVVAIPTGHEKIILIDDQPEVAATLRRVLMRLGYRVDAFTSPLVALDKVELEPDRYDLMVSDLVMPDLSGEELANRVRKIRKDMPIIICTAYNPRLITVTGAIPTVLNKPIDPAVIAKNIRELLDN